MSRIKKLNDRKAALIAAMRKLSDAASEEGRALTEEEEQTYEANKLELADVERELERERELQEFERNLEAVPDGNQPSEEIQRSLGGNRADAAQKGWDSFGEYLQAVVAATPDDSGVRRFVDPRLTQEAAGLSEGVASEGGFLVGTDFSTELLKRVYANNQVISGGAGYAGPRRMPLSAGSNSLKINAINETSRADGSRYGGVRCYWQCEASEKTDTKPDFRQMEIYLKKLVGLCYATDELLQDAAALEAVIMDAFSEEMAFKVQDGFFNGTGAGQMLGILNAGCLVSVTKETGQAADTIVKENIDKMYSRMWARGLPTSVWHVNQDCYPQLFALHQAVGAGGVPVYMPPGGMSQAPYGTLYGRPVVPVEQCQTLGDKGDIFFCDWSQYLFSDKGGIQSASSIHVRFIYDETTFRFVYRCDGQPAWNTALTPYKGTSTVGPFVALNAR